jgi:hypothetical protein
MTASIRVLRKKNPNTDKIMAKYKHSYTIKVGFPEGKADVVYPENPEREKKLKSLGLPPSRMAGEPMPTVKQVAAENEFGVPEKKVPARPFMKKSTPRVVRLMRKFWKSNIEALNKRAGSLDKAVQEIAPQIADVYKKMITDLHEPPNTELTIMIKGSDNPLIDSGLMRSTVTYDIVKDDK